MMMMIDFCKIEYSLIRDDILETEYYRAWQLKQKGATDNIYSQFFDMNGNIVDSFV